MRGQKQIGGHDAAAQLSDAMAVTISAHDLRHRAAPILLSQAFGLGCGLIGVRLTSELVAPADYGVYGIFVSIAPVGATVVCAGLVKFVTRHWQASTDRPRLLREVTVASLRKAAWLIGICAAATFLISPQHPAMFAALLCVSALLLTYLQFAQSALQSSRRHWRDFSVASTVSLTRSFLPPLLYATTTAGLVALLAGFTVHAAVGAIVGAMALREWWPRSARNDGPAILTPIYDGPQFVVLAVSAWVLLGLNRWVVAWLFGAETAGLFTLATNLGTILPIVAGNALLQYFLPQWFAMPIDTIAARRHLLSAVDRIALFYTIIAIGLTAVVYLVLPHLIGPLINARYLGAIGFVLGTVATYYHVALIAAHRERACLVADLSGAVCLIVGTVVAGLVNIEWLIRWLIISPIIPWIINRSFARASALRSA
jgi:hypothetical protein